MAPSNDSVVEWLLASDPSIRWQVMRDLLNKPEAEWSAERAKVETEGWGAAVLARQDADGQWAGGAFWPSELPEGEAKAVGQPWTATCWALEHLCEFGLDPASEAARRTVELVGKNSRWEEGGQPYWEGETEECINGRTVAAGAYLGADVSAIVDRLLGQRMEDGGWNCERERGSVRSSFASTVSVLEGLLQHAAAAGGGAPESVAAAREAGEEYLLSRHLFRRLSTGAPADDKFLQLLWPTRWRYDVLRALDYFRSSSLLTGRKPDARLKEAVEHLRAKRRDDGKWEADWVVPGRSLVQVDGPGQPSPWVTLRALRVLRWWDDAQS